MNDSILEVTGEKNQRQKNSSLKYIASRVAFADSFARTRTRKIANFAIEFYGFHGAISPLLIRLGNQNVSPAILSRLRLWKHSRNAIPQQRGCTSPVSSALLIVRRAVQHRVQVSQLRADEPLSSRNVPSISKSHRAVLDRKVGERS